MNTNINTKKKTAAKRKKVDISRNPIFVLPNLLLDTNIQDVVFPRGRIPIPIKYVVLSQLGID